MTKTSKAVVREEAEIAAGRNIQHERDLKGTGQEHICMCSCGWRSSMQYIGPDWEHQEWVKHIEGEGAQIQYSEAERIAA